MVAAEGRASWIWTDDGHPGSMGGTSLTLNLPNSNFRSPDTLEFLEGYGKNKAPQGLIWSSVQYPWFHETDSEITFWSTLVFPPGGPTMTSSTGIGCWWRRESLPTPTRRTSASLCWRVSSRWSGCKRAWTKSPSSGGWGLPAVLTSSPQNYLRNQTIACSSDCGRGVLSPT